MKRGILILIIVLSSAGAAYILKRSGLFERKAASSEIISPISDSFQIDTLGVSDNKGKRENYTVYGYLPYWTIDEVATFQLDNLTDVAYFGLHIDKEGNFQKTEESDEETIPNPGYSNWRNNQRLANFIQRAKSQDVRVALTVISHVDDISTDFLNCRDCWDNFYKNLKIEMDVHQIEDVNLNFEYYQLVDKQTALKYTNFTKFVKTNLQKDFDNPKVVVTTFADSLINNRVSDVPTLAKVADGLFIMGYDFHVTKADKASPVSPLGGRGFHAGYDIRTMIRDYLSYAPPQKLILGVPYYGFNWGEGEVIIHDELELEETERSEDESEEENDEEVEDNEEKTKSDDSDNKENEGDKENREDEKSIEIIKDSLTQSYAEIMKNIEENEFEVHWDELGQVPYYEYEDEEAEKPRKVYFENKKSLTVKYRLIKEFDLSGVGIWALGYDGKRPELWELLEIEF